MSQQTRVGLREHPAARRCTRHDLPHVQHCVAQVPTWRADPLTPACDQWCEFPVSDRPNAVKQFFNAAREEPTLIKVLPAAADKENK